ncbi:hypothetical protein SAMN04489765_1643 [Tsukamurella pulmonis]|uniref:Glycine zipper-like domain-containing protein n=1 Tax=Tsukamurella pulmonis TaxID=47312 RepID=A0A1H1DC28_9ACTN|nr:hypothetical protein SAMN04489765_1643 [Tsukamurella pulmonis]SUP22244.1 Uncharacterised protein [Tsukamurella pulmonis]
MRGVSNDGDGPTSGKQGDEERTPGPWSDKGYNKLALGLAIGAVLGVAIGTSLGNPAVGIGIGLALGIAFATAFGYRAGGDGEDDEDD